MATYYSPHFSSSATATAVEVGYLAHVGGSHSPDPAGAKPDPGFHHARKRSSITTFELPTTAATAIATNDLVRLMTFRSGDRITDIRVSNVTAVAATTLALDMGLYYSEGVNAGAVIDLDLFASIVDGTGVLPRDDWFTEAGTLADEDRGKPLWVNATTGDGSFSEDPGQNWDLVLFFGNVDTVTVGGTFTFEVDYVAGD